jgi:quercetin dioxygenase-like cupin family protein
MEERIKLCEVRENLKAVTRGIIMMHEKESLRKEVTNSFSELYENVEVITCSLDSNEMTVVNVKFNNGGSIPTHSHDRIEHIYVIDGEIIDRETGKTYRKGEVYVIPAGQKHFIESDFALLVVTWTPAYD